MKRLCDHSNAYKEKHLVHDHHGGKQGSVKADTMLEEPRGLHLDLKVTGSCTPHWVWLKHRRLQSPTPQWQASSDMPRLLLVTFPISQAGKHMSLWGQNICKPHRCGVKVMEQSQYNNGLTLSFCFKAAVCILKFYFHPSYLFIYLFKRIKVIWTHRSMWICVLGWTVCTIETSTGLYLRGYWEGKQGLSTL